MTVLVSRGQRYTVTDTAGGAVAEVFFAEDCIKSNRVTFYRHQSNFAGGGIISGAPNCITADSGGQLTDRNSITLSNQVNRCVMIGNRGDFAIALF